MRSLVALALWALLVVLIFRFYNAARFLLMGALGATALAATLRPLADRLPGPATLRAVAAMLIFLAGLAAALGLLGYAMADPIRSSIQNWPDIRQRVNRQLVTMSRQLGIDDEVTVEGLARIAGEMLTGGSLTQWIPNLVSGVLATLLAAAVIVIGAMYLLARPRDGLAETAVRLLPPDRQQPTLEALKELVPQLRRWVMGTAFSMAVVGVLFGAGYWLIGLEFALPLAIFAALLQAVPNFGPLLTLLLSLLIAATQGTPQVVGVTAVYVVVQTVESYFLTPMVMRQAVRIPPIVTLFTIILWGNIFGVAGLLLAIPLDLTIWAFLKHHLIERHADNTDRAPT